MKPQDILNRRLYNQYLSHPTFTDPADVVKHFGAVQAQEYQQALFSIGLRMKKADESTVEKAITDRSIVRTWPMRGTLHFVPAEDAKWMLNLLTPRVQRKFASMLKKVEVNDAVISKSRKLVEKLLLGGNAMSRDKLMDAFDEHGISTKNQRGYQILAILAQHAVVCFGEKEGKQQTLVLFDEWIKKSNKLDDDETLKTLALRFYTSHGPATMQDLMWWGGLTKKEVEIAIEINKDDLISENIDGMTYYSSSKFQFPNSKIQTKSNTAWLLPAFDEYTIAYKDRHEMVINSTKILNTNNGFWSSMVLNGQIVGTWRRELVKDQYNIQLALIKKLTAKELGLFEEAGERYASFFGMKLHSIENRESRSRNI